MKTTRRKLLGLLGLGAAAAALGTSKTAEAAPLTERERIEAVLAHPEQHPEVMARANTLRGGPLMPVSGYADAYMHGHEEGSRSGWNSGYKRGLEDARWEYGDDFGHKTDHAVQWSNVFLNAEEIAVIVPVPETARG